MDLAGDGGAWGAERSPRERARHRRDDDDIGLDDETSHSLDAAEGKIDFADCAACAGCVDPARVAGGDTNVAVVVDGFAASEKDQVAGAYALAPPVDGSAVADL
jgi:hypothetical protein